MQIPIYNLAHSGDVESISRKLAADCDGQPDIPLFPPANCSNLTTVKEIISHHKTEHPYHPGYEISPDYFLVVDRFPVDQQGILHVNINHCGAPDARRMPVDSRTGLISVAFDTACQNWDDHREQASTEAEAELQPYHQFVVYNLLQASHDLFTQSVFDSILLLLDNGIDYVFLHESDKELLDPEKRHPIREIYLGVCDHDNTIDQLKEDHATFAASKDADAGMFMVVDATWKEEGFLFVRPGRDGVDGGESATEGRRRVSS